MVYPNPCSDILNVSNVTEKSIVRLFNMMGAEIAIKPDFSNNGIIKFSTSMLKTGVYFVVVDGKMIKLIKN